ncbi:MFS transporter [Sphaerisporangium corydalis]|uniref:MFS transporter n=1 Tax=Sphaerisporangium corydalis TaxID=1441875 RepID=A0ABV9EQ08_9ACTN|nr:MFS transporter [Sphaerisporangium corydalis]
MNQSVPLRRQRDYRLLWSARAVSETGTEISRLAVPLTAAALLGATPLQMGLLTAATTLPYLLIGLPAGAYADRLARRRPILIACEVASAIAVLTVPLAWVTGLLTVPWLIAVAFTVGTCSVFYRAAWFPHLPSVVADHQRTAAITGFQTVYSAASVCGPGLAGVLVQTLTAPFALVVDALSFLMSAVCLRSIRSPEKPEPVDEILTESQRPALQSAGSQRPGSRNPTSQGPGSQGPGPRSSGSQSPESRPRRTSVLADIREGLRAVVDHRVLRALITTGMVVNFASAAQMALFILFAVNTLGLPAGVVGLLTASFGAGGLAGAAAAPRLTRRFTENRVILGAVIVFPLEFVALASAHGSASLLVPLLMGAYAISGLATVVFSVCYGSIQLRESPPDMLGRVNAVMTVATMGIMTLGGITGGLLGEVIGLRPALWTSAALVLPAILAVWLSPLRHPAPATA